MKVTSEAIQQMKNLKVRSNSIRVGGFFVVRTRRNEYRIGEATGQQDWLMHGTLDDIVARMERGPLWQQH